MIEYANLGNEPTEKPKAHYNPVKIRLAMEQYGFDQIVLARIQRAGKPLRDLVWIPGHMVWDPLQKKKVYTGNCLAVYTYEGGSSTAKRPIHKGGRLTALMKDRADTIDHYMGETVSPWLKEHKTVLIDLPEFPPVEKP